MKQLIDIAEYDNFFIDYQAPLKDAIEKMNENGNGSVVLLNENFPVAMLTQSDIINALSREIDLNEDIYHYATQLLITAEATRPLEFAIKLFFEHNIRRIVLVDEEKQFAGVVLQEKLFDHMGEDISKGVLQSEVDKQLEKRMENEYLLMQQSKLATMGEMIGHIAHQWRQPLAQLGGIFMNLDAAYAHEDLSAEYLGERIQKGNELIKYMSQTIDDFRHFFEPNDNESLFDVQEYVESAINIIQASLTYAHIELEVSFPENLPQVKGYASEFSQVILNLLDNAKDVLIEREITNPKIQIEAFEVEGGICVTISDNAGGIDPLLIDKIFDIYFSTKHHRGGSGLGLYMSKLIIERKGMGRLHVQNSQKGASFSIFLKLG
jgi:signal transduction histidine kinase